MHKNRETTLKGVILLMSIAVVFTLMFNSVSAVTNNTSAASATANVLETISVTLSGGPVTFSNLNAGTNNNTAVDPLNISIDLGTNVNTNISQNSSDFSCGCGDTIAIANLRYANASDLPNSTVMTTTYPAPPYANWDNITKPSSDNAYNDVYYWLTVPNGTTPGTYTTDIYINVTAYQ